MPRLAPATTDFARQLRTDLTEAERTLWQRLRTQAVAGMKFRRQHPIGPYVADFACISQRLVVELDGGQHADSAHDAVRDAWLLAQGWRVLRFWNNDVMGNLEGVLMVILDAVQPPPYSVAAGGLEPPPQPSPLKGEGAKTALSCLPPSPLKGEGAHTALPCLPPSPFKGEGRGGGSL